MNLKQSIDSTLDFLDTGQHDKAVAGLRSIYDSTIANAEKVKTNLSMSEAYLLANTVNIMQIKIKNSVDMRLLTEFGVRLSIATEDLKGNRGSDCEHLRGVTLAMLQRGGREVKRLLVDLFNEGLFKPVKIHEGINNYLVVEMYFLALTYFHYERNVSDSTILPFYKRWGKIVSETITSAPFSMKIDDVVSLGEKVSEALFEHLASKYKMNISFI